MKKFRVKLEEGHHATRDQIVDGYLGNVFGNGKIAEYTRGEAIKKARAFGGKIEEIEDQSASMEMSKKQADEIMELVYIETPSGFHIGLDATYIDQVGDFKITLPTGEEVNTKEHPGGPPTNVKTFILTHEHRHGTDHYTFKSSKDRSIHIHAECYEDRSEIEDIIKHFDIDFENRYSETIDIAEIEEEIPVID